MMLFRVLTVVAFVFAGLPDAEAEQWPKFYDVAKQGWFWYEEPAPEPEKEEATPPMSRPVPSLGDYSTQQLWDMHPDDFQDLLMEFQKKAVQRPTEENVRDYLTMQDLARRKAAAYANVASYVIQKYADLDVGREYPVAAPGVIARVKMQKEEISATIQDAAADHALLYFASQDCSYCQEQQQILRYFTDRYGWQIKEIDVDAKPAIAARFGIQTTPSLLLIAKDRPDYIPVASGVVALDELERSLYRSIRLLNGQITPQEYSVYDFQKGGGLDPESILKKRF
jgi:conjugal transfer pilus assembly protein TraF